MPFSMPNSNKATRKTSRNLIGHKILSHARKANVVVVASMPILCLGPFTFTKNTTSRLAQYLDLTHGRPKAINLQLVSAEIISLDGFRKKVSLELNQATQCKVTALS